VYKQIIFISLLILFPSFIFAQSSFKDIRFDGLTQISNDTALEISNFKANEPYTEEKINKILKKFYDFQYFIDIKVSSEDNILIFTFTEKPFIINIQMQGYKNREDDLKRLYNFMNIKKGNMYSPQKLKQAKSKLLYKLEQEGYINSVVETEVEYIEMTGVSIKFIVNKGEEIIITDFNYNGSKELDEDTFRGITFNKAKQSFSWWFGRDNGAINFEHLNYDSLRIQEAYLESGFLDIKVQSPIAKIDFSTNTATINIGINEGRQYKINNTVIYVDHDDIIDVDEIYPKLTLIKDKIFNIKKLRKDVEYIKTQMANKGYAFTQVQYSPRVDKEKGIIDIVYNVIAGDKVYINDVIISGNIRTLDRVIRRNIYLAPKDLFNLTDFKDSRNALNRTGFFETVDIKQQRVSKNKMNLLVEISEASTGNLIVGGGYGDYQGWVLNASIADKNIFGSGLNLGLSFDFSEKKINYDLSLINPAFNDSKYSSSISIYQKDKEIRYTNYKLNSKSVGVSASVGRSLTRHMRAGAKYSLNKKLDIYDTKPQDNKEYIASSITPYINFNNTDSYFNPRTGVITGTKLEIAGLGGDVKYLISSSVYKYFKDLENYVDFDIIFRYKASLKLLQDSGGYTPKSNTFYLGGVGTVRGYRSYSFGPATDESPYERMFANSFELSFPFIKKAKMRCGVFYDYGMIGEKTFNKIKRSSIGALVEWFSPVGPFQFIFSKPIDDEPEDSLSKFEFSLGSKF